MAEGSTEASRGPDAEVPPGSKSRACARRGSPGTWESLPSPRGDRHGDSRVNKAPGPPVAALGRRRERRTKRKERYRQAKDNEARRDGRQAVGTPRITEEAGELTRKTRSREGGVGLRTV